MDERRLGALLNGRRVLVTGHTGFKGGWLCMWLHRLGAQVIGIALPQPPPSFSSAVGLDTLVDSRIGDIRSQEAFDRAVGGEDFELLIHMAAQPVVRTSFADPVDTYLTNVVGTAVVLESARRMPSLKGIIVVTSDKCYDNREWVWGYRESDPMGGSDPYSSSKGCAELVAAAYRSSFFSDPGGPQLASVRAGNVIGGGDWGTDRLVPDLMRAVGTGHPTRIRNPGHIRPWQHVMEPVRGYLMLAACLLQDGPRYAGAWNFGPGIDAAIDVETLAALVTSGWDGAIPGYVVERRPMEPKEAAVLRLDSTKARIELGWVPLLSIEGAVEATNEWYRAYYRDPGGSRDLTLRQIEAYADLWHRQSRSFPVKLMPTETTVCA